MIATDRHSLAFKNEFDWNETGTAIRVWISNVNNRPHCTAATHQLHIFSAYKNQLTTIKKTGQNISITSRSCSHSFSFQILSYTHRSCQIDWPHHRCLVSCGFFSNSSLDLHVCTIIATITSEKKLINKRERERQKKVLINTHKLQKYSACIVSGS